jgi:choline dehydrogenase-like flavoprotein
MAADAAAVMEVITMRKFDAIIIGTGQAGSPLAARLVDKESALIR